MQQIADWLEVLGMSDTLSVLLKTALISPVLPDLTDQDLEELGVALGDRRNTPRAIASLKTRRALAISCESFSFCTSVLPWTQPRPEMKSVSDLVGSTALSARMVPVMREVITAYQKCVAEVVRRFGGYVAQYMGDGVLVYFGYPQLHEDDAERAVCADCWFSSSRSQDTEALQARVGIATGLAVIGHLSGSGDTLEHGVVGETPNLLALVTKHC